MRANEEWRPSILPSSLSRLAQTEKAAVEGGGFSEGSGEASGDEVVQDVSNNSTESQDDSSSVIYGKWINPHDSLPAEDAGPLPPIWRKRMARKSGASGWSDGPEYCGPCLNCEKNGVPGGGDDRLIIWPEHSCKKTGRTEWRYMCRHCSPSGGDAIEFARKYYGLDFPSARRMTYRPEAGRENAGQRKIEWTPPPDRKTLEEASAAIDQYLNSLTPLKSHPYLMNKGVHPCPNLYALGLSSMCGDFSFVPGDIAVPVKHWTTDSEIVAGLQVISADSRKAFVSGSKYKGGYFRIAARAGMENARLLITEGLANGLAVAQATGHEILVAFAVNNLKHVAMMARARWRQRDIVLACDNDMPETAGDKNFGITAAVEAAALVAGFLAIPYLGGKKCDFNDMWQASGNEAVAEAVQEARRIYQPDDNVESEDKAKSSKRRFSLTRVSEIEIQPPSWLVEGYLTKDCLALLYGDPEAGKSFVAVTLACCVASGEPFFGRSAKTGPVVYIAGEGRQGMRKRFQAWCEVHGKGLEGMPLYLSNMAAPLTDPAALEEVKAEIDEIGERPAMIVVDTLARNFGPEDENSTAAMNLFVQSLDVLRERYGAAILAVHHSGHQSKNRARGSSVLRGALDFEFMLGGQGNAVRKLACSKCKDFQRPPDMGFRIEQVISGDGDEEVASAVLKLADYVPIAKAETLNRTAKGKNQLRIIEILRMMTDGQQAGQGKRITVDEWRDECKKASLTLKQFKDAMTALEKHGTIAVKDGHAYLVVEQND